MTAALPSLECVPVAVRGSPRYVGDHIIRHYRPLGLAVLLRDLGADPTTPELVIEGGIGRLVLRADGSEDWQPAVPDRPAPASPPPLPAPPVLAEARRSACALCEAHRDDRCTASACGCTGEGRPDVLSSRCPLARWPAIAP